MAVIEPLESVDRLKRELDQLRPLAPDVLARVSQKLRIDANYHSNAIEGNSLTLGETRSLLLHGLTASGKPMRDHLDIEGHDSAVKAIEEAVKDTQALTQVFIRSLHEVLLKEPYEMDAVTPEGQRTKRTISLGQYKSVANNVLTSTGEIYFFTPPDQVPQEMADLLDWYRARENAGEHPVITAASFHYRFVRIHPFDDGNGRMARLLMNMILMKYGYTVAIVQRDRRNEYLERLEEADRSESLSDFIAFVASCCEYSLDLHLRAAKGESIEEPGDIDREIDLFKQSMADASAKPVSDHNYIETTWKPCYQHLEEKTKSLTELFGSTGISFSIEIITMDGEVVQLGRGRPPWPLDLAERLETSDVRSLTFRLTTFFRRFQSQDYFNELRAEHVTSGSSSQWEFRMSKPHYHEKCEGLDLHGVQQHLNEMLRLMMGELSQRNRE